jgi:hypothetical protein
MEKETRPIEIKVRLHHIESGKCMEVWQVQTEKGKPCRYLSRDDGFGVHEWSTLADAPYGYCEQDCHLKENVVLIICDKEWNELFRDYADRKHFPESFPSLDEACNEAWGKVVKDLPRVTRTGYEDWITQQAMRPLGQNEEWDWMNHDHETAKTEVLSRFTWIGEEYGIFRLTKKHTKCDACWYEYYAGKIHRGEYRGYAYFFAYEYHERHICEILSILGKKCNDMDNSFVETRQDECGHTASYFMDEFIGHNLTYQQIQDAKESRFLKACDDYKEANAYYYTLKNNENSTRGIEAELYFILKQIEDGKMKVILNETIGTRKLVIRKNKICLTGIITDLSDNTKTSVKFYFKDGDATTYRIREYFNFFTLPKKEQINWQEYRKDQLASLSNERLWALGYNGSNNPHLQNIEDIEEELHAIDISDYDAVINKHSDTPEFFNDFLLIKPMQ